MGKKIFYINKCTKVKGGAMSIGWANNLDLLAQSGVLDFDAPAYVLGQPPRYVGNPGAVNPLYDNPPRVSGFEQPKVDEFKPSKDDNLVKTPAWKKWLFGLITAGVLVFIGYKFKTKLKPLVKNWSTKTGNFFSKCWKNFTGIFKRKS